MPNFYDMDVIEQTPHHPAMSDLVDLLCHRTGNVNRDFFQAEVAYFLGLLPSSMRAKIKSPERGTIPINIYSIALATSGFGKGHSVSVMEEVLEGFREDYMKSTFNDLAETNLFDLEHERQVFAWASKQSGRDGNRVSPGRLWRSFCRLVGLYFTVRFSLDLACTWPEKPRSNLGAGKYNRT